MPGESEKRRSMVIDEFSKSSVNYIITTSLLMPGVESKMMGTHPDHPIIKELKQRTKYKRYRIDSGYLKAYILLKRVDAKDPDTQD